MKATKSPSGTSINIEHRAASGIGARIKAEAVLESFDGRFYTLRVTARDDAQEIGRGTVGRAVVHVSKVPGKDEDRRALSASNASVWQISSKRKKQKRSERCTSAKNRLCFPMCGTSPAPASLKKRIPRARHDQRGDCLCARLSGRRENFRRADAASRSTNREGGARSRDGRCRGGIWRPAGRCGSHRPRGDRSGCRGNEF